MADKDQQLKENPSWERRAGRILGGIALAVLLLVPVTAFLGGGAGNDHAPAFLVAWGGDGGVPAVALLEALPDGENEAVILLPGSSSAGNMLRAAMQNDGINTLSMLFLPTGSPYPRGAKALLKGHEVRRIVVAEDARSRGDWQGVVQPSLEGGTSLERLQPQNDRQWTTEFRGWSYSYRRLPDGENEGDLWHGEGGSHFVFRNLETGEFRLECREGKVVTVLLELPRLNHGGSTRVPMAK